jgi:hypothetical protein
MLEHLGEVAVDTLAGAISERIRKRLGGERPKAATVDASGSSAAVRNNLRIIAKWATEISFRDLVKSKGFQASFVDLDLMLGQPRISGGSTLTTVCQVSEILTLERHLIILGDPGAGKTTSLKRVAITLLGSRAHRQFPFPLLLQMRDYTNEGSLSDLILGRMGISVMIDSTVAKIQQEEMKRRIALSQIDDRLCVVMIDGIDEMHPTARDSIVAELRHFVLEAKNARFLVTCRTGDWLYHIENATVLTLKPLTSLQISEFAHRWLGASRALDFLKQIKNNPYSGSEVRPLTLAHLCAIYERSGSVPEKPRTVYRKIVRLMLEEWDEQRSVIRVSRYSGFSTDRKEDFLQAFAYQLTVMGHTRFTTEELKRVYEVIHPHFGLPQSEATTVVREIESHTGLILESASGSFEFAHKSLQEYLAAAHAVKLPNPPFELLRQFPNETALVIALSADPNVYFHAAVDYYCEYGRYFEIASGLVEPLVSRILLESVDFVRSVELGFDVLRLAAATYKSQSILTPTGKVSVVNVDPVAYCVFIQHPIIKESVTAALHDSDVNRSDEEFLITRKMAFTSTRDESQFSPLRVHRRVISAVY